MAIFLGVVGVLVYVLIEPLQRAFAHNPPLNGLIVAVTLIGILYNIRQVLMLGPEVTWIRGFRAEGKPSDPQKPPRLLGPMARMLSGSRTRLSLSALSMRSLLDGIASRLDESRELSRYVIGLLIFLGLLGTFWGLLQTIGSVAEVISGLAVESSDLGAVFDDLKRGLKAPLSGMGTAFSSSLFGLSGSLILGFLDLQAGQAQNRFFNDLEEWLSEITRLSTAAFPGEGEQPIPAYLHALLERTAEGLESLQQTLTRGEEDRTAMNSHLLALAERIGTLTDQMRTEQTLMLRLAEGQSDLKPILTRFADTMNRGPAPALDEATRAHIRNLEVYVARLVEDIAVGRDEILQQVRSDIKLLARTIAALDQETER
jgi:hypothetical protein